METMKECPYYGERTLPLGAALSCECTKKSCRFETAGKCMIIDGYFRGMQTAEKMDAVIRHLGTRLG
jgi:hypothetical protein